MEVVTILFLISQLPIFQGVNKTSKSLFIMVSFKFKLIYISIFY